jgi:hypothetical protein
MPEPEFVVDYTSPPLGNRERGPALAEQVAALRDRRDEVANPQGR